MAIEYFSGPIAICGRFDTAGNVIQDPVSSTLGAGQNGDPNPTTTALTLYFWNGATTGSVPAYCVIPTTGFAFRNNANNTTLWSITNAGVVTISAGFVVSAGQVSITPTRTVTSGASADLSGVKSPATTITLTGTTQVTAAGGFWQIAQPTLTDASAVTVDTYATLYIANAPTVGGSVTLTNAYALWVDAGNTRLDGTLTVGLGFTLSAGQASLTTTRSVTSGASADLSGVTFPATTITITGTTQVTAAQGYVNIAQPVITDASAVIVDTYATVYIANSPSATGSVTLTAGYAFWVDAGTTRLDGTIILNGKLNQGAVGTALAVASNTITPTKSYHLVDSSGGAVTVKTITAGNDGDRLTLQSNHATNDVTFDETANIVVAGGATVALDTNRDCIEFIYNATISKWCQIAPVATN